MWLHLCHAQSSLRKALTDDVILKSGLRRQCAELAGHVAAGSGRSLPDDRGDMPMPRVLLGEFLGLADSGVIRRGIGDVIAAIVPRKHDEVAGLFGSRNKNMRPQSPGRSTTEVCRNRSRGNGRIMRRRRPRRSASSRARRSAPQATFSQLLHSSSNCRAKGCDAHHFGQRHGR
jgi:hypothetical protein